MLRKRRVMGWRYAALLGHSFFKWPQEPLCAYFWFADSLRGGGGGEVLKGALQTGLFWMPLSSSEALLVPKDYSHAFLELGNGQQLFVLQTY